MVEVFDDDALLGAVATLGLPRSWALHIIARGGGGVRCTGAVTVGDLRTAALLRCARWLAEGAGGVDAWRAGAAAVDV